MPAYKDSSGKWFSQFQIKNKNAKIAYFKRRGFSTKREAIQWEAETRASYENKPTMKFSTFVEEKYYPYEEQIIKPTSMLSKKCLIKAHILPYFKDMKVGEITIQDIIEWHSWLMKKDAKGKKGQPLSPCTLGNIHGQLHHIMRHAMRILDLPRDVVALAGTIGTSYTKRESFWSLEEFIAFRTELSTGKYDPQLVIAYDILFWGGLRTAELMGLYPSDCDFEKGTLNIERNYLRLEGKDFTLTPKTSYSKRTIKLPDYVVTELKDYLNHLYDVQPDTRIFTFSRYKLIRTMKTAGKKAGIKTAATPHTLRHGLAVLLEENGFPLTSISRQLGHGWYGTTLRYLHAPDKTQDRIAETLNTLAKDSNLE